MIYLVNKVLIGLRKTCCADCGVVDLISEIGLPHSDVINWSWEDNARRLLIKSISAEMLPLCRYTIGSSVYC